MGQHIYQAANIDFADGAQNVIMKNVKKRAKSVKHVWTF